MLRGNSLVLAHPLGPGLSAFLHCALSLWPVLGGKVPPCSPAQHLPLGAVPLSPTRCHGHPCTPWQVVMSFHACGGNVGDNAQIPLPKWVMQVSQLGG
jgi:hypothetical protein